MTNNNANAITVFDATIFTHLADHFTEGRQNPEVISMREMMAEMWGVDIDSLPAEPAQAIVTNKERMFGAINIYNEDCIKQVQDILETKNFYVLPSVPVARGHCCLAGTHRRHSRC